MKTPATSTNETPGKAAANEVGQTNAVGWEAPAMGLGITSGNIAAAQAKKRGGVLNTPNISSSGARSSLPQIHAPQYKPTLQAKKQQPIQRYIEFDDAFSDYSENGMPPLGHFPIHGGNFEVFNTGLWSAVDAQYRQRVMELYSLPPQPMDEVDPEELKVADKPKKQSKRVQERMKLYYIFLTKLDPNKAYKSKELDVLTQMQFPDWSKSIRTAARDLAREEGKLFPPRSTKSRGLYSTSSETDVLPERRDEDLLAAKVEFDAVLRAAMVMAGIGSDLTPTTVKNTFNFYIKSSLDKPGFEEVKDELIVLLLNDEFVEVFKHFYVRQGAEHEQVLTSLTPYLVLGDLLEPRRLPGAGKGKLYTFLDLQHDTNVPTDWIIMRTTERKNARNGDNKVVQNHHPTSKANIWWVDKEGKPHSSPGAGGGSSGRYHLDGLKGVTEKDEDNMQELVEGLIAINQQYLAEKGDILAHGDERAEQYLKAEQIYNFSDAGQRNAIATIVADRKAKVLHKLGQARQNVIAAKK